MLYVGSLAKIYPLVAAFELRRRVTWQAKDMIKIGLSTATTGWQNKVFAELKKGWQSKLDADFRSRGLPSKFPKLAEVSSFHRMAQRSCARSSSAGSGGAASQRRSGGGKVHQGAELSLYKRRSHCRRVLRASEKERSHGYRVTTTATTGCLAMVPAYR